MKRSPTAIGVAHVVRDEDHAEALLPDLMDVFQHHRGLRHAERRGRLVEDQDLGAEIDRARDRHALALAARKGADRLVRIAHVDADLVHLLAGDLVAMIEIDIAERPDPLPGSRPMKKLRVTDISGIIARSW